jgi:hypothetical protein
MPILPSGRRVEFSLDRFHAFLARLDCHQARRLAALLNDPDDLLNVLDAVHFGAEDRQPFFAGYVASDWTPYAAEWSSADREALRDLLASDEARFRRAEAIDYIRGLVFDRPNRPMAYPYVNPVDLHDGGLVAGSRLRQ